jgi:hypothetical protein
MKRTIFYFAIFFISNNIILFSQSSNVGATDQKSEFSKYRVDYAVPQSPAFKILDIGTDNVMRPGMLRELGVDISTLYKNGGAIEIAPMILSSNVNLADYKSDKFSRFLYRSRISAGIVYPGAGATNYSLGYKFTLLDETDLVINPDYEEELHAINKQIIDIDILCSHDIKIQPEEGELYQSALQLCSEEKIKALNQKIDDTRKKYKELNWNKTIWEAGLAILGTTIDSTIKKIQSQKYGLWSTAAFPLSTNGQILFAGKIILGRDSTDSFNTDALDGSFISRGYLGNNSYKAYLEIDWNTLNKKSNFISKLGTELNILNGLWVNASIGLQSASGQDSRIVSSFGISFATPE